MFGKPIFRRIEQGGITALPERPLVQGTRKRFVDFLSLHRPLVDTAGAGFNAKLPWDVDLIPMAKVIGARGLSHPSPQRNSSSWSHSYVLDRNPKY